jgi:endoglucanase
VDVNVSASSPLNFSNIAYTLHYYTNLPISNLVSAQGAINLGLPIFVTEYGACSADGNGYVNVNVSKTLYSFLGKHE